MDDKTYNAQKRRLRGLGKKWFKCLGLGWWKVDIEYDRDGKSFTVKEPAFGIDQFQIARVHVDWEYSQANVIWNIPAVRGRADRQLEEDFLHESAHILIREMREWANHRKAEDAVRHEERVVTALANAFRWIWLEATEVAERSRKRRRHKK